MKPLIAVHSCEQDSRNGRYDAIMETWGKRVWQYADLLFFKGQGEPRELEVVLDCYDGNDNLIEKEQAMFRWIKASQYQRVLKTETDVYFDLPKLFAAPHEDADVIGDLVGHGFGQTYADSWFYCFPQGHAVWYSRKAFEMVADNLVQFYTENRPNVHYRPGTLDPGPRAADLWGAQILTKAWRQGDITMRHEKGFSYGPLSYHHQGNDAVKAKTPEWIREMEKKHA